MVATLCLYGCLLTAAQSGEWTVLPRLGGAQELVYRGTFSEEANGGRVQFNRAYRVETRLFVLDAQPRFTEVAILTVLKPRERRTNKTPPISDQSSASSVRLEIVRVDLQGKVLGAPGTSLLAPLEGPPTIECGAFVEVPRGRIGPDHPWDTAEEGRPARTWKLSGSEIVNATRCLKLVGVQQSDDWDKPRADRTAWRRTDTVWLAAQAGIAHKVERVIERREPARQEPTQKSTLRYDLESTTQYTGQLGEDRRHEIEQARHFAEIAAPLIAAPAKSGPQLNALSTRIAYHLEHEPATPYREAVLHVRRRVEAAKHGEAPAPTLPEEIVEKTTVATVGQTAPDFTVPTFTGTEPARMRRWLGKPVLMVFYNPASTATPDLLHFAQRVHDHYPESVHVIGLATTDDAERVRKQRDELKATFPILNGSGLRISYAVEATPKLVLVDAAGIVRRYLGWGEETASEVTRELKRWLPRR